MNAEERDKIRQKIVEGIEKLGRKIKNLKEQTKPIAPDNAIGRLTRMEAINSKSIQEANFNTAKQKLSQLKVAQQKIDHEDFGHCRECEEAIPMGRLFAMPEITLCVQCASKGAPR